MRELKITVSAASTEGGFIVSKYDIRCNSDEFARAQYTVNPYTAFSWNISRVRLSTLR